MDNARLETATLAHVDDSYYYGAYCRRCKHSARLSLSKLRTHLGDTFPLKTSCGANAVAQSRSSSPFWRPTNEPGISWSSLAGSLVLKQSPQGTQYMSRAVLIGVGSHPMVTLRG